MQTTTVTRRAPQVWTVTKYLDGRPVDSRTFTRQGDATAWRRVERICGARYGRRPAFRTVKMIGEA